MPEIWTNPPRYHTSTREWLIVIKGWFTIGINLLFEDIPPSSMHMKHSCTKNNIHHRITRLWQKLEINKVLAINHLILWHSPFASGNTFHRKRNVSSSPVDSPFPVSRGLSTPNASANQLHLPPGRPEFQANGGTNFGIKAKDQVWQWKQRSSCWYLQTNDAVPR